MLYLDDRAARAASVICAPCSEREHPLGPDDGGRAARFDAEKKLIGSKYHVAVVIAHDSRFAGTSLVERPLGKNLGSCIGYVNQQ